MYLNMKIISIENELYPEQLKHIKRPPQILYVLGNEKILNNKSLSIIGSRNATNYGREIARKFAKNIAKQGINIVSGMAKGIDSEAHLGAIEARGNTIAVLGSGFNHIFPDKKIFQKILDNNGAIITEYKPDTEIFSDGFRRRNRIVAGISLGTFIVEAKEKSGTSITAEYARQFERKIFCIPHLIEDKHGIGTNRLLKRDAILITDVFDILKHYEISEINYDKENYEIQIPKQYQECYNLIGTEAISANEISKKTNKSISEINTILTMLELEGAIKSLPGNLFIRTIN